MADREPGEQSGDLAELEELLWKAARKGNVPAMRILLDRFERDGSTEEQTTDFIDELARKREQAATGT